MIISLLRLTSILYAKILGRPIALCDMSDVDGITSASLFKIRYPRGIVILALPPEVRRSLVIKSTFWTFVADLPCPGKVYIRADHHATNTPCAEKEFYDPKAPASALLALKALGLEGHKIAENLVELAVETDTANIRSREASMLDAAVKGTGYLGKLYLASRLAEIGIEALKENRVRAWIKRYESIKRRTEDIANIIKPLRETVVIFRKDIGLSYRYLSILLERKGAEFTFIIVPRKFFKLRIYAGAKNDSRYDASTIASLLGGGGHKYAAGATLATPFRKKALNQVIDILKNFLEKRELEAYIVQGEKNIERKYL